jgi:hypothetical protein
MKRRIGFKLKVDKNRFILKTASRTLTDGYMQISFTDEYIGSSVMVYAYNPSTRGYSDYLYSEKSKSVPKALMRANEKKLTIQIGRYTVVCRRESDFKKIRRAMRTYRLINETDTGTWPRLKSSGSKKLHPKLVKKKSSTRPKVRR